MKLKNPMLVVTDMDKTVEFYKRVIDSGMTPEQAAERMDVPVEYINKWVYAVNEVAGIGQQTLNKKNMFWKRHCRNTIQCLFVISNTFMVLYEICKELSLTCSRAAWDMNTDGMWKGNYKGIDDWELRGSEDFYGNAVA